LAWCSVDCASYPMRRFLSFAAAVADGDTKGERAPAEAFPVAHGATLDV
jgi:hypothetical protein